MIKPYIWKSQYGKEYKNIRDNQCCAREIPFSASNFYCPESKVICMVVRIRPDEPTIKIIFAVTLSDQYCQYE